MIVPCALSNQAIMPKMILRISQGKATPKTLEWASREIEGFSRN